VVRAAFARVLKAADLPEHFTPHALRHSFVVHLIQANVPLPYVQAQAGHASIQMTVNVYGRWLPTGDKALVDRLDTEGPLAEAAAARRAVGIPPSGDRLVTDPRISLGGYPQVLDSTRSVPDEAPPANLTTM
jgi:hypothetical protein